MRLMTILSIFCLACACACVGDDGEVVWFEEVAAERGLVFTHESGHDRAYYMPEAVGGGAALFDMDGDGDLDAYLVQSGKLTAAPDGRPGNRLFRNTGGGRFEDVTAGSGADDRGYGMGVVAGDYDADGDIDLYVTNLGPNVLLRNEGGGRFSDRTEETGSGHPGWGTSAVFCDVDRDGDLDLFVANYLHWSRENENDCYSPTGEPSYCGPRSYKSPEMDTFYRNRGDGTFADETLQAGFGDAFGNGLGVVCADFDGDDWPDLFVANDGTLNQLWVNRAGQRFENDALLRGVASDEEGQAKAGMGVVVADVDDDQDLDLLVGNLHLEGDSFHRNEGNFFSDSTAAAGLALVSRPFTRFGMGWVDFDNDGRLDLYQANGRVKHHADSYTDDPFAEPNLLFRGTPAGRWEEVLPRGGVEPNLLYTSRAAAFGDVDGDGGQDILVVNRDGPAHLLHNVAPRGHWIEFRVPAGAAVVEGAAISAMLDGRRIRRDVRTSFSYLASNSPWVHFGLGSAERLDDVSVRWPDGTTETLGTLEANTRVTLERGKPPRVETLPAPSGG